MKRNLNTLDRIVRVVLFATTVALFLAGILTGPTATVLLTASTVLLLTSLVRFCPLYAIFGLKTSH